MTIAPRLFSTPEVSSFRAAYNVVLNTPNDEFITASSGNFGQALAYACKLLGKNAP